MLNPRVVAVTPAVGWWPQICSLDCLYTAYLKARKGKRKRADVQAFELDLEFRLVDLQKQLSEGCWQPGPFRRFTLYDRKPRDICAAPFADRIVHHAIVDTVMPAFDAVLSDSCAACRRGMGVHRTVRTVQRGMRRHAYVLQLDISRYFPSIDHAVLKTQLRELFDEAALLAVLDRLIDAVPSTTPTPWPGADLVDLMQCKTGLPIGNLSSQHFGNLYLAGVDELIREQLLVPVYQRYVDDLLLLSNDKRQLWHALSSIEQALAELHLVVHPHKIRLQPARVGVDVLGYRVWPYRVRLRNDNGLRFRRRLHRLSAQVARGECGLADVRQSINAWLGHTGHASARSLEAAVLGSVSFSPGSVSNEMPSGAARRWLEQQTAEPAIRQPQQEQPR